MRSTEHKKGGNSLIFGTLLILNVAMLVMGVVVLTIGIYSCEVNNNFSWYNGSFVFIGVLTIFTGFVGHMIRYSPFYMFVYEVCLGIIFVMQLIFGILVYTDSHLKLSNENERIFEFVLVQQILNITACIVLATWYWRSLETANKPVEPSPLENNPKSPFIKP